MTITPEENRFLEQLRREYPGWTIHKKPNGYVAWKHSIYAPTLGELANKLDRVTLAALPQRQETRP